MIVKEIMTEDIVTVDCNETILNACNVYRDRKVGSLIVTDKDDIIGIITERDFIERTICMQRDPSTTKIKEIMTTDVKTIGPHDRVQKALDIIKEYNIKKLPVVFNNEIVGIITITDIAYTRPSVREFLEIKKD